MLIHGAAGGIGMPAIQVAKLYGAEVIATASTEEKRRVCLEEGADHAIAYQGGFRDRVMELTQGRGVDIIYDPVNGPTFEESLRCLAWGGRILILGFLGGAPALARTNYLLIKGVEAIGVRIGGLNESHPDLAAANTRTLFDLAAQGKLKPRVWRRYPLARPARRLGADRARGYRQGGARRLVVRTRQFARLPPKPIHFVILAQAGVQEHRRRIRDSLFRPRASSGYPLSRA